MSSRQRDMLLSPHSHGLKSGPPLPSIFISYISIKLNTKPCCKQLSKAAFPDFLSQPPYVTHHESTDRCGLSCFYFSSFVTSWFRFSLFTCPLCPHHVSSNLFTLVPCSLPRLWIPALPLTGRKPTPASKIAPVLTSELKRDISTNERSDNHMLRRGRGRRWADGSVQFWEDKLPQRLFLPGCRPASEKGKNAFIPFQIPQRNETEGLSCNLKTGTLWTTGSQKHWFGTFGLWTVCFFFPSVSLTYK